VQLRQLDYLRVKTGAYQKFGACIEALSRRSRMKHCARTD